MLAFADSYGTRRDGGPLDGAPYDAVDADGTVVEASHLLWPLTEAGKVACSLHAAGIDGGAERADKLVRLVFGRFFAADRPFWVNQMDGSGNVLWPDALSRLIYHVLLFVTEGARAGLWELTSTDQQ